jgi:transcriptional regulator with XRE-family HTH domain
MAVKIKAIRERRGLTQEQLAEKAGISRTYLARLETARQDPTSRRWRSSPPRST